MSIMKFPINSKGADPILTSELEIITLNEINDIFQSSSVSSQSELCKRLGISIFDGGISLSVYEIGRAYEDPEEDHTKISENETSHEIKLSFSVKNCAEKFPLPFTMNLSKCTNQIFVNFYGELVFRNQYGVEVSVPLVGRGTVALEGRENDAHAQPCNGGRSASFQQKVSLLSSILAYFRITRDEIEILRAHLLKACEKFYGRNDILNYTIDKAFSLTTLSYFEYLKNIYKDEEEENIPIMLQHFIEFAEPHPIYFVYLKDVLTPEELYIELHDTSHNPKGPDKNPISPRVREIINKLIFLDEIYMVKPYPGNILKYDVVNGVSIYHIERELKSNSILLVKSAFEKFGVTIKDGTLNIKFFEIGRKYAAENNRNLLEKNESEETFELNMNFPTTSLENLLKLKLELDINAIDYVNFFGKIEIKNKFLFKNVVPLLGRGSVVLEGQLNDKHCGFCACSEAATFQQKVALISSLLVVLDVNEQDFLKFEYAIKRINSMFYGLHDIIEYTIRAAKQQENGTYYEFMQAKYINYLKMPIVLKTIVTYNRLPPKYFEGLVRIFTENELIEEEKRIQSIRFSNFIPKMVQKLSNIFVKINIF